LINYIKRLIETRKIRKEIQQVIENIDIEKIKVMKRNNELRDKLLEKAMYNLIFKKIGQKIYIDKKYSKFEIITKSDYELLPAESEIKKNIPFLFYPYVGEMSYHWWIYRDGGGLISKLETETNKYDLIKFFASEEDFERVVRVAFEGLKADLSDIEFVEDIISYYKSLLKKTREEIGLLIDVN
jgi:hypothetical protein